MYVLRHYRVEVAAYDIQTQRCDVYGSEEGYAQRAMVLYDGLHYDALALAGEHSSSRPSRAEIVMLLAVQHQKRHNFLHPASSAESTHKAIQLRPGTVSCSMLDALKRLDVTQIPFLWSHLPGGQGAN